jgi:hypothetical protein
MFNIQWRDKSEVERMMRIEGGGERIVATDFPTLPTSV